MFTFLTSPASFASSLVPLPSLLPPPISASWSGHGLSTAASTLSAPLLQWCSKLRPAVWSTATDNEGLHAPVLCLIRRPGSWKQLKAWFRRKTRPPRECTEAVSASVDSGEAAQRVSPWLHGCRNVDAAKIEAKVPVLSPVARSPIISEATPPLIPRFVKPPVPTVPLIRKPRRKSTVAMTKDMVRFLPPGVSSPVVPREVAIPALAPSPQPVIDFHGPKKPALAALKPCLTLRPTKPKRTARFAESDLVQEYTRWNFKGQSPINTRLVGSPYEWRVKRVRFSMGKLRGWAEFERYLEPDGHNQVSFPRTKWIRDGPSVDDVDFDGDVEMCDV